MTIRLKDIAAKVGLSTATVSQILNGRPLAFNAVTRERVLTAARELGYRRNAAASAIKRGSFGAVALVQDALMRRSTLDPTLLQALHDALSEHDLHLMVAFYRDEDLAVPQRAPKLLRETLADGLLINYHVDLPAALRVLVDDPSVPAVWLNLDLPNNAVRPDDLHMAQQATEALLERGHRRIAYGDPTFTVGAEWLHYSRQHRYRGYVDAMTAAGLQARLLTQTAEDNARRDHFACFHRMFAEPVAERPTAVVCYGYPGAIAQAAELAGLHYAREWLGPRDFGLIGFGDGYRGGDFEFAQVGIDWSGIAVAAVDMLRQRIADPLPPRPTVLLPGRLLHPELLSPPVKS